VPIFCVIIFYIPFLQCLARWIIQNLGLHYGVNHDPDKTGHSYPFWNIHAIVIYYNLIKEEEGYEEKIQCKIQESIDSFNKPKKDNPTNSILKKLGGWFK